MILRITLLLLSISSVLYAQRPLRPTDVYRLKSISAPAVSPEGKWIAYVLSSVDSVKDRRNSDIWMTDISGTTHLQLTYSDEGESQPSFSTDGKMMSFLS